MSAKIRALQEAKYSRLEAQIDIDEADEKIASDGMNQFDVRRELLLRQKAKDQMTFTDKLINDALAELNTLYKHFKALPKFTREQFEAGERQHFAERLRRQTYLNGAQQSIVNMETDMAALLDYQTVVAQIENIDSTTMARLLDQLSNLKENHKGGFKEPLKFTNSHGEGSGY